MPNRLSELLALGPDLLDEAKRHGKGVNESYFLVHRVLAQAFKEDLARIPDGSLRKHLTSRLEETLRGAAA
jgi:hypothetical protein